MKIKINSFLKSVLFLFVVRVYCFCLLFVCVVSVCCFFLFCLFLLISKMTKAMKMFLDVIKKINLSIIIIPLFEKNK